VSYVYLFVGDEDGQPKCLRRWPPHVERHQVHDEKHGAAVPTNAALESAALRVDYYFKSAQEISAAIRAMKNGEGR